MDSRYIAITANNDDNNEVLCIPFHLSIPLCFVPNPRGHQIASTYIYIKATTSFTPSSGGALSGSYIDYLVSESNLCNRTEIQSLVVYALVYTFGFLDSWSTAWLECII